MASEPAMRADTCMSSRLLSDRRASPAVSSRLSSSSERLCAAEPDPSLCRLISEDEISTTSPTRPSPIFTGSTSREHSYYDTTACHTPVLDGSLEKEKFSYEGLRISAGSAISSTTTFHDKLDDTAYQIQRLHDRDDNAHMSSSRRFLARFTPLFTILSVGSYFNYFFWRIKATIDQQNIDDKVYVLAWAFIAAEGLIALPGTLHNIWLIVSARGRMRPQLRLAGDVAPTVDVFITCCKEDVDVVLDTVRAACGGNYPQDRFRVLVLDDGADPEMLRAVESLRIQYPNLYYHARVKVPGVPHHFKAGNLIGGTELVLKLEGGPGEYIAALDADMIVQPDWLRAIVSHAVLDPKVALVCPPQLFYNVPPNDPLVQSLDAFVHVMEPAKDATGVAWCTGSGYIIRRSALDSIGGWPIGSLAEDVCTSSMLLGAGWKTVYCHEALQYGLVPDTYTGHLKQRTRWTLGTLQTAFKLRFFLFSSLCRKMTFFQRLSGFVFGIDAIFKLLFPISIATLPVILITGKKLVAYADEDQLRWLIRWCMVMLASQRLNEWVTFIPSGYRLGRHESRAMFWMAPYHATTILRFIISTMFGWKHMAFTPSGSLKGGLNERDALRRAPLLRRLKVILINHHAYMHVFFILFTLAAVGLSTARAFLGDPAERTAFKILESLLTHAFWPPVMWIMLVFSLAQPVIYAVSPPTMPEREDMLDRDTITGIAQPKQEWKDQRWTAKHHWHEGVYNLMTVYTVFLFVGTFLRWEVVGGKVRFYLFTGM